MEIIIHNSGERKKDKSRIKSSQAHTLWPNLTLPDCIWPHLISTSPIWLDPTCFHHNCPHRRALWDQVLSIVFRTGNNVSNLVPSMRPGSGNSISGVLMLRPGLAMIFSQSDYQNRDRIILSPRNFILVPQMRPKWGVLLDLSREWEWDREFHILSSANETGTGPYLVPGMRPGQEFRRVLPHWAPFNPKCILLTSLDPSRTQLNLH